MSDRRIAIALFADVFVPYGYCWGTNQEATYSLTRAVVEARTSEGQAFWRCWS